MTYISFPNLNVIRTMNKGYIMLNNINSKLVYSDSKEQNSKLIDRVVLDFTNESDLLKMIEMMRKKRSQSHRNKKADLAAKKLAEIAAEKEQVKARILARAKNKVKKKLEERREHCETPRVVPRREQGELKGYTCKSRIAGWPLSRYFAIGKYGEENAKLFAEISCEIISQYIEEYCGKLHTTSDLVYYMEICEKVKKIPFEKIQKLIKPLKRETINIRQKEVMSYFDIERMTLPLMLKAIQELPEIERLKFVQEFSKIPDISSYKMSVLREYLILEVFSET